MMGVRIGRGSLGRANNFQEGGHICRSTMANMTPPGGQISVLGIRFTPPNNSLTTIPALANVGTGGGSIAHLASGGDGWQTTFVLVNNGTSSAQATLSFFNDQTGTRCRCRLRFRKAKLPTRRPLWSPKIYYQERPW